MSDGDRLLPFDGRRLMDERAILERPRLDPPPSRMIAHQQGALKRRQMLELEFEQVLRVEFSILQGFVNARPLAAEDRRTGQLRKGNDAGRSQDGIHQFKERIAGPCQTFIDRLAESRQLVKLRLDSVFVVHISIALSDSGIWQAFYRCLYLTDANLISLNPNNKASISSQSRCRSYDRRNIRFSE